MTDKFAKRVEGLRKMKRAMLVGSAVIELTRRWQYDGLTGDEFLRQNAAAFKKLGSVVETDPAKNPPFWRVDLPKV